MGVTLGGAFLGGMLSFLSPCVLPLVPPYLCYIAGVSHEELAGQTARGSQRRVMGAALAFVIGFSLVFIAFGATASALGQMVVAYGQQLSLVAGGLIILFGLHFLGILRIPLLYRQWRAEAGSPRWGLAGALLMGMAFAFGWTPCVGPILASILFLAGAEGSIHEGMALLAVYAAGIGLPFLLAAGFAGAFIRAMTRFRRHLGLVEKASGLLLVATGILFMTGGMGEIAYWLLEALPALGRIG